MKLGHYPTAPRRWQGCQRHAIVDLAKEIRGGNH